MNSNIISGIKIGEHHAKIVPEKSAMLKIYVYYSIHLWVLETIGKY